MQPIGSDRPNIEARYRTIITLWLAVIMSVLTFLAIIYFIPVEVPSPNRTLSLLLNILAIIPFGISLLVKQRILNKAIGEQRLDLVKAGYVAAFALCEAAALLSVVDHFINNSPYFYVGFIFAGLGLLLHFPQKKHLLNASNQQF